MMRMIMIGMMTRRVRLMMMMILVTMISVTMMMAREHNRVAGELEKTHSTWDDEKLYLEVRFHLMLLYFYLADQLLGLQVGGLFLHYVFQSIFVYLDLNVPIVAHQCSGTLSSQVPQLYCIQLGVQYPKNSKI